MVIRQASIRCETIIDQIPSVYVGLKLRQYRITKADDYSYMDSRLIRLVEKWACNVAGTVSEEKNRISDNFLGVTYFILTSQSILVELSCKLWKVANIPAVFAICMLKTSTNAALYGPVR